MPLTPQGGGGFPGNISSRAAFLFGVIVLIGALAVGLLARRPVDGLMLGGFGLVMLAWGGLMSNRGSPRLLLALGVVGGVVAFAAALMLVTG